MGGGGEVGPINSCLIWEAFFKKHKEEKVPIYR